MHKGIRRIMMLSIFGAVMAGLLVYSHNTSFSKLSTGSEHPTIAIDMPNVLTMDNVMPLVIIGSGCAGLSAAVYGARSNIKTLVIIGNQPGGQLTETSYVENWPGSQKTLGSALIENLKKQAQSFGAEFLTDAVERIDYTTWPYQLFTEDGKKINALSIIFATGASPRKLGIPGEQEFWGKGVTTCAICDAPFHKGDNVIVVGGGDSAVEEALQLSAYAKTVTVIVRKDVLRASAIMQQRMAGVNNIEVAYNAEVKEIFGDAKGVTAVTLYNNHTNESYKKEVGGVFLAIGHIPNTALAQGALEMDSDGYLVVKDRTQKTSMPGIFAAGDAEDKKYRQAGVASGSGIKAALDAQEFLHEHGFNAELQAQMEYLFFEPSVDQAKLLTKITTAAALKQLLDISKVPVVVDFYTPYCPSCTQMMPSVELMAHKFEGKIAFVKVDASQALDIAKEYRVNMVPCLLCFKDGKVVDRYNKALSKKELYELVQKLI